MTSPGQEGAVTATTIDASVVESLTVEELASTPLPVLREQIPRWLAYHAVDHEGLREATGRAVAEAIRRLDDADLARAITLYRELGTRWRFCPACEPARTIGHAYIRAMPRGPRVAGVDGLRAALEAGPTLVISNHLSYADSQFTDYLLATHGARDLADRLVFVAGPKVYESPLRRMAALTLNTLPTVQSTRLGRGGLSPRRVAEIALGTVRQAGELMTAGRAVVLYAEGTRSRDRRLGPFIKAVGRYASVPGTRVVPLALTGTDVAFPVHHHELGPARVTITVGDPIAVGADGPAAALQTAWHALAALLPDDYRPAPSAPALV